MALSGLGSLASFLLYSQVLQFLVADLLNQGLSGQKDEPTLHCVDPVARGGISLAEGLQSPAGTLLGTAGHGVLGVFGTGCRDDGRHAIDDIDDPCMMFEVPL